MTEGVPNHDWARVISEPTTETIDRCLQLEFAFPDPIGDVTLPGTDVLKLNLLQTAALHRAVRAAVAAELLKIEHGYSSRPGGLVAPANVAYHLAERGREIAAWEPTWCVVTTYPDGEQDEQPFSNLSDAELDLYVGEMAKAHSDNPMTKKLRMR